MNKKIVWLSALTLAMSVSQASLACDCKVSSLAGDHFEQMTGKLDLTADQKAKIKVIGAKAREDMKPKFMAMREIRMQLNALASSKELDQDKIDKLIDQNKEILGSLMKMRVMVRHDVDMVLTDKQRAKMDGMISDWKEKQMKNDES